jgi:hypothetical protein
MSRLISLSSHRPVSSVLAALIGGNDTVDGILFVSVQVSIGQAARAKDPRHALRLLERAASLLVLASGTADEEVTSWKGRLRTSSYAAIIDVHVEAANGGVSLLPRAEKDQHIVQGVSDGGVDSRPQTPPEKNTSVGGSFSPALTSGKPSAQPQAPLSRPNSRGGTGGVSSTGVPRASSAERVRQASSVPAAAGGSPGVSEAPLAAESAVVRRQGEEGGARTLLLHKLWSTVANIAARVGATEVVIQVSEERAISALRQMHRPIT